MSNIESILANSCALVQDRPLIVGVSGGADSLCLMDILREAGYNVIVAHFDHQLREESAQDAAHVKSICETFSLECVVESADVRAYAKEKKRSIEEAARELRYRFLFQLAREKNAQAVAVGHTADDQIETVLMHILRGSGLNGLKGMSYRTVIETFDKNIPLARPLLEISRAETVAYCAARHLDFLHDASNDSLEYKRNRIRHELIPLLETFNPQIKSALMRLSQNARDDLQILDSLEDSLWRDCATLADGFVALDLTRLANSADATHRRLIRRAMRTLIPDIDVTHETLMRATDLTQRREGAKMDLQSGLYGLREGNQVYIATKDADLPLHLFPQLNVIARSDSDEAISDPSGRLLRFSRNDMPAKVELANGWKLTLEVTEHFRAEEIFANENRFEAWFDADALAGQSLHLRNPRAGDKIRPLGLNGRSQKLSDLFVNEKIPRRAREDWVLLCMGDEILWVAGLRASHLCRVTEKTTRVIHAVVGQAFEN